MMGNVDVQIGAPYMRMGLIKASNSVVSDLKETLDLFTVRLNPKNARVAF